ncbi:MAG: hypothetical protein NTY47_06720 [Candidatus Omnitrophica bacterium]|nr:hypothetical protein [Candidatus Omnitrophota bacterium]
MLIPLDSIKRNKKGPYVLLSQGSVEKPLERNIETGISDEKNTEVVSGLSQEDKILIVDTKYVPAQAPKQGSNPFMPSRARGGR